MIATEKFDFQKNIKKAMQLHRCGDLRRAAEEYTTIVAKNPSNADANHLLGVLAGQQGDQERAIELIHRAIRLAPDMAMYHVSLGDLYQSIDDFRKSTASYRRALQIDPNLVEALCNLGNAYREKDRHREAIACYRKGLSINSSIPELYNNIGQSYLALKNYQQAIKFLTQAIGIKPGYVDALTHIGNAYRDQGYFTEAEAFYAKALDLEPRNAYLLYSRGISFHLQKQFDSAMTCYRQVMRRHPDHCGVYINIGKIYHDRNDFQTALAYYEKADAIEPQLADARFYRSLVLLTIGRFEEGWRSYESRFARRRRVQVYPHQLNIPRWNGQAIEGKRLLVHCEQGFGDSIQFARYLPYLKSRGCRLIFEVRKELLELFKHMPGVDQLTPLNSQPLTEKDADYYIPLLSLPGIFQTTLDTIPAKVPYLQADPDKIQYWKSRLGKGVLHVGITWKAKSSYRHDKSCPLELIESLPNIADICIYSLQKYETGLVAETLPTSIQNWGDYFTCFADTAGAIQALDLVISVDTAVAHLAGALGKRVWTLLPFAADWRWLTERNESPWYPTMRLYRQSEIGDWNGVIEAVKTDLSSQLNRLTSKTSRWKASPLQLKPQENDYHEDVIANVQ
jgi:tetratricopeptide (TPR) repeat protein